MTSLIYCDASVLVARLIADDAHRDAVLVMDRFVAEGGQLLSSELAALEVSRAVARLRAEVSPGTSAPRQTDAAFDDIDLMDLDRHVIDFARRIPGTHLGSLDAIHVASALMVGADVVLTRDRRMAEACEALGLAVA